MGRINPLIAIGIPTWGRVTVNWARAYRHMGGPLGSTCVELEPVVGRPIAEARNTLMAQAIAANAEFLFMLGDDNLMPGNTIPSMLQRFREHPEIDLITGVYWTKTHPTQPYLWRGMQRGPFFDWKVGEFVPVDFAGCDALMIRLSDRVKALGPDWFATDWVWTGEDDERPSDIATEDFYFYTKARKAGIDLWCDTALQGLHEDRNSGMLFGLSGDMPQAGALLPALPDPADGALVRIADIGCGGEAPFWGFADRVAITRIDLDESKEPDIRADVRRIPVPDQSFDLVHSRHVLEHFGRAELVPLIREWVRILRVGGELRLNVPNARSAMEWLIRMDDGLADPNPYPSWQLYGRQDDERDYHKNWFTPRRMEMLLEMPALGLTDVNVVTVNDEQNIQATAVKREHLTHYALTPEWDAIAEREGLAVVGLAPKAATVGEAAAAESAVSPRAADAIPLDGAGVLLAPAPSPDLTATEEIAAHMKRQTEVSGVS